MNYQVEMWLSYSPLNPEAEEDFRKRFPVTLEKAWAELNKTASNLSDLANQLNAQILSDCKESINSDTGVIATDIIAFTAAGWVTGGVNHTTPVAMNIDVKAPSSVPWTFKSASETYQMTAACSFDE